MSVGKWLLKMDWATEDLYKIRRGIWEMLVAAASQPAHPFRTPGLGTHQAAGCGVRTVILRRADPKRRELVCFSDERAKKVDEIQSCPRVTWLFYHRIEHIQVRAQAVAVLHHGDSLAKTEWELLPLGSRSTYHSEKAPGTEIRRHQKTAQTDAGPSQRSVADPAFSGWQHFVVIRTKVIEIDWLHLGVVQHRRARFSWKGDALQQCWLVP